MNSDTLDERSGDTLEDVLAVQTIADEIRDTLVELLRRRGINDGPTAPGARDYSAGGGGQPS